MVREMSDPSFALSEEVKARLEEMERTTESLREDSEVAHVLLGLSGVLAEVRSIPETLETAIQVIAEIMGADRAFAATWADQRRFRMQAHTGFDPDGVRALLEDASQANGMPLLRRALEERRPLIVPDVAGDESVAFTREVGAYIGIPLIRWGEEFGGIGLEYDGPQQFGNKETALARGIARQVGVALVNARRFNLLGGLRAFGLSVASRLRLDAVIDQVAWGATALLGGDAGAVYFLDAARRSLVLGGGGVDMWGDRFARIDLDGAPWNGLVQGRAILVNDMGTSEEPLSIVAAPIPGENTPILGAVAVFFQRNMKVAVDETEALSVLAGQAGMAVENAQRFERQRRVSRSLQTALLSTDMPDIEGFTVAAFYEPAAGESEIGGDFYDVFELTTARYAVVVGDVSGKGAEAAARTAMAKYMLRAFAIRNPKPSSVMFHLNNALAHDLEPDRFCTLVYGELDVDASRFTLSRGGHPPPLVYRAAEDRVEVFEEVQGTIIGAFEDQQYQQEAIHLGPGDVLLLYTDGLIETRNDSGFYGRRRIEEGLRRYATNLPVQHLTNKIYQDAAEWGDVNDDTVVFALRRDAS